MPNRIKVGISVYNDWEHLDMLLQSIRWYTFIEEDFDIVVCDDGSHEDYVLGPVVGEENGIQKRDETKSVKGVCAKYGATLIRHERNLGIPSAWNSLVDSLGRSGEIVVILNNDLLMPPNWLRVITHFLDANRDNPHVGSAFWNPYNRFPKESMRAILPMLGHTIFTSSDQVTGKTLGANMGENRYETEQGRGEGLGRVMCPCGCCFAVRMSVFDEVGQFDPEFTSFHEESKFGSMCAAKGRAAFGFPYPRPYHVHGAAFASNPELEGSKRMADSRKKYREYFGVPDNVQDYFGWVHEKYMSQIPKTKLKFLSPDYSIAPEERFLPGGEKVLLPRLVEREGEF